MPTKNLFYAQSGGVTAVINATAQGVIEAGRNSKKISKIYAGKNGILGAIHEELYDTSKLTAAQIKSLSHTPGGAFGSCRYKLKDLEKNRAEYQRLIEVFSAHNIGYFLYNGGGDSQDTTHKVSQMAQLMGYPLTCIGIPKTIDNDLPFTDNSPGFGSVAKYVAVSTIEASLDVLSMAQTSTKVFILEVMGRHSGWIAAASGLGKNKPSDPPHIILFPEVVFNEQKFLHAVTTAVREYGYCTVVASEGIRGEDGEFVSASGLRDAFGHAQLGGVAPRLADLVKQKLNLKNHWAVADYLQRSARHIASATDVKQAYQLGKAAVQAANKEQNGVMLTIVRATGKTYRWSIGQVELQHVANQEKLLPIEFLTPDQYGISKACKNYLQPLIAGELYPPYENGLPKYLQLKCPLARKKLPEFSK